jgi:hypothetical protein
MFSRPVTAQNAQAGEVRELKVAGPKTDASCQTLATASNDEQ